MNFNLKRITILTIPLFIFPIFLWNDIFNNIYYITPISFFISYFSLINLPKITQIIHEKPIYFEDLNVDVGEKMKFQNWFIKSMEIILSFVSVGLTNYTLYKLSNSNLDKFEIMGMFGGIISLYTDIQNYIGKIILYILDRSKRNYIKSNMSPEIQPMKRMGLSDEDNTRFLSDVL